MNNAELNTYVPVYDYLPEDWDKARTALLQYLKLIANNVNYREIGTFYNQEVLSGQRFVPSSNQSVYRPIFRKVIPTGTLPNNTTSQVAHGITINSNTQFIHIYGGATNPSTKFLPLPYTSSTSSANCIEIFLDSTYINIKTGANYSTYTTSYVVLEYLQTP